MSQEIGLGTLVEHPAWGRGKVVEFRPPHVVVYFPSLAGSDQGARRTLQLVAEQLSVSGEQSDPAFDRVSAGSGKAKKAKPAGGALRPRAPSAQPLEFAVAGFRAEYPGLFQDPKLTSDVLDRKRAAHQRFVELLGEGRGRELLSSGASPEITSSLVEAFRATNIPSPFERMGACDGLKDEAAANRVLKAVLDFVDSPVAETFHGLTEAVGSLPAPARGSRVLTWPNVTILPFLADPSRFMVLKPAIARQTAARMGFDLPYTAFPEWHCYEALQRMASLLRAELSGLGATDYIDVYSFMWVTKGLE
jgi:hypothetical protein